MEMKRDSDTILSTRSTTRREFLVRSAVLGGVALAIAGCGRAGQPIGSPKPSRPDVAGPVATSAPAATRSAPTDAPAPTRNPTPASFSVVSARVVHTRHASVWNGEDLNTDVICRMLDASITRLVGRSDSGQAWASLFAPHERIAIKVNALGMGAFYTHTALVTAITERLQEAGVSAGQIVIFDRRSSELTGAGYAVNVDGPGVRCYGTDGNSTSGWTVMDTEVGLSDVLLDADALINVPFLKQHDWSGISYAMKNHYGTFTRPSAFHGDRIGRGISELNALPPIQERTRLIVGDALMIVKKGWHQAATGDSITMSRDPVAHDAVGLQLYSEMLTKEGGNPAMAMQQAKEWLDASSALGLGVSDPDSIELVEVALGPQGEWAAAEHPTL